MFEKYLDLFESRYGKECRGEGHWWGGHFRVRRTGPRTLAIVEQEKPGEWRVYCDWHKSEDFEGDPVAAGRKAIRQIEEKTGLGLLSEMTISDL